MVLTTLQIFSHYNIHLYNQKYNPSNGEISANCPFHDDTNPSFSINNEKRVYHCFGCQKNGYITDIIERFTGKSRQEAYKELILLDGGQKQPYVPSKGKKSLVDISKTPKGQKEEEKPVLLNDEQLEVFSWYIRHFNEYTLLDPKTTPAVTTFHNYLFKERGVLPETAAHFKLGFTLPSLTNKTLLKGEQPKWGWQLLAKKLDADGILNQSKAEEILRSIHLITDKGNCDFWWDRAIIIPYGYNRDNCFVYAEGRTLPPTVRLGEQPPKYIKYLGMKGFPRYAFFNADILSEPHKRIFVVEGAMNAILMHQNGYPVVAFGPKNCLSDELISHLFGHHVVLYYDLDDTNPYKERNEAAKKLSLIAKSVSVLELPQGEDPASLLPKDKKAFEKAVANIRTMFSPAPEWMPHEIWNVPQDKNKKTISLAQAQENVAFFSYDIGVNLPFYAGKFLLLNYPVGTHKTSRAIDLINYVVQNTKINVLVLVGQHNLAHPYMIGINTTKAHLYGATHRAVQCAFIEEAKKLIGSGHGVQFKKNYCHGICGKTKSCLHITSQEEARYARVLVGTHAHGKLPGFFTNKTYNNNNRQLIIIDEYFQLVDNIWFTENNISENLEVLKLILIRLQLDNVSWAAKELAKPINDMVRMLEEMLLAIQNDEKEYIPQPTEIFDELTMNTILRWVSTDTEDKYIPKLMLNELVYGINKKLVFKLDKTVENDNVVNALYYRWQAEFPPNAVVIMLSATTTARYLEMQLGNKVYSYGEQYNVVRENLRIVQLLVNAGRTKLYKVSNGNKLNGHYQSYKDGTRLSFDLVLRKHRKEQIMMIISLGGGTKEQAIAMLQDIATKYGKKLVPVSTEDLEKGTEFADNEIPVIHYSILGTNIFGGKYSVLIELNAYFYPTTDIIKGIRVINDVTLFSSKFKPCEDNFVWNGTACKVKRYGYIDEDGKELVSEFVENNSRADMAQAEGRITRGEDNKVTIYRLHNENIRPYPTVVYRSRARMHREELNWEETFTGKLKIMWEWIKAREGVFTVKEAIDALGGYKMEYSRILSDLHTMEYVELAGKDGKTTLWRRT